MHHGGAMPCLLNLFFPHIVQFVSQRLQKVDSFWVHIWTYFRVQWSSLRRGGRVQDPQLLRHVRHRQRGPRHGEDGRGNEVGLNQAYIVSKKKIM